jgi:hypothetical protein
MIVPSGVNFIKVVVPSENSQVELGSTATTYEAYRESFRYNEPTVLRRVLNAVADTIESGNRVQRVQEYTLQSADMTSLIHANTNNDYVIFSQLILEGMEGIGDLDVVATKMITSRTIPRNSLPFDSVETVWRHSFASSNRVFLYVPKGTYADLAAAQADLAGTGIIYQLATPVTTYNVTSGNLQSYPSGTVYYLPQLPDSDVYTTQFTLSRSTPATSIVSIQKYDLDTNSYTSITPSTAVIAGDGLSFTHTSLTAGDIVFIIYAYAETGCYGLNTLKYLDGKFVVADTANGKHYRWAVTSTNGVAAIALTEVV